MTFLNKIRNINYGILELSDTIMTKTLIFGDSLLSDSTNTLMLNSIVDCHTLRKIPKFHLISWCGNFEERYSFRIVSGDSPRKLGEISVFYAVIDTIYNALSFKHRSHSATLILSPKYKSNHYKNIALSKLENYRSLHSIQKH